MYSIIYYSTVPGTRINTTNPCPIIDMYLQCDLGAVQVQYVLVGRRCSAVQYALCVLKDTDATLGTGLLFRALLYYISPEKKMRPALEGGLCKRRQNAKENGTTNMSIQNM